VHHPNGQVGEKVEEAPRGRSGGDRTLLADGSVKQASGILVEIVSEDNLTDSEINAAAISPRMVPARWPGNPSYGENTAGPVAGPCSVGRGARLKSCDLRLL
jgi:hypothetical protein